METKILTRSVLAAQKFEAAGQAPVERSTKVDFGATNNVQDIHSPTFKEDKKAKLFKYGENNLYPDFLLDLFLNKSGKHRAIIEKKVTMVAGQGWEFDRKNQEALEFWKNERGSNDLDEMAILNSTDDEVFYYAGLIVRWNADRDKIAAIDFLPAHKIRKGTEPRTWWVSDNWQHYKKPESKTRQYVEFSDQKGFPDGWSEMTDAQQRLYLAQIVIFKNVTIGSDAYPHVPYQPFIHYLLSDYQVGKFTLNNIRNGYTGGYHIDFVGEVPDATERKATKRAWLKEYTNSEGSNVVFTWTPPDATRGTTLTALPTNGSEDAFLNVDRQVLDNIFIAHRVTSPLLFGFREAGSLGGKQELLDALAITQATEITPKQQKIEKVFNMLARVNGITTPFTLKKYTIIEATNENNTTA